jgi:TetR/AcrR family fatty acid metabolism transcriptional regulator
MQQDKKLRIMQAAEFLFGTKRVHEVTLEQVAQQADVGKGTIYLYFTDKEDLVFQTAVSGFDEMCQLLRERAAQPGTFRERLLGTCAQIVDFFRARRPLFRIILSEGERVTEGGGADLKQRWRKRRQTMAEAVSELLEQGMAAGELRKDIPPKVLAEYLLGLLRTRSWELEGWPESQRSHAKLVDLFLMGATATPAAKPQRTPEDKL